MNQRHAALEAARIAQYQARLKRAIKVAREFMRESNQSTEKIIYGVANCFHLDPDIIALYVWPKVG